MNVPIVVPPFDKLSLPTGEQLCWTYYNRTFHRMSLLGIGITEDALYLCSSVPFLFFINSWRRYPFAEIVGAEFRESKNGRPTLIVQLRSGTATFRTPYDDYEDEVEYDRQCLREAVALIVQASAARGQGAA